MEVLGPINKKIWVCNIVFDLLLFGAGLGIFFGSGLDTGGGMA